MANRDITINIDIEPADLAQKIKEGARLCATRDVKSGDTEHKGNVLFLSLPSGVLGPTISLPWSEKQHQVYGSSGLVPGEKVNPETVQAPIENGQIVTFLSDGRPSTSGFARPGHPLQVTNQWKDSASFGVEIHDVFTDAFHSIFISPSVSLNDTIEITPTKKGSIFWDLKLETDTMVDPTTVESFPIDLTEVHDAITVTYKDGKWSST